MAPTMTQTEINASSLLRAAERGDADANRAYGDFMQEEMGVQPVQQLQLGDFVLILTATHYFCGRLVGQDHEYYVLAKNSSMVFETGEVDALFREGQADIVETIPTTVRVLKGGVIAVIDWPWDRSPNRKNDKKKE